MPQAYEPAFSDLLDLLARMIETLRGTPLAPDDAWQNDAQVLAMKVFRHACSLKQLSRGGAFTWGEGCEATFIDHASIKAIARAQLETMLVFFYVFGSGDPEITAYRHQIWKLGGLKDRLGFRATKPDSLAKQQIERQQADAIVAALEHNPHYRAEPPKRRQQILKGKWRHDLSWTKLGEEAGFHPFYIRDTYSFLCGYSHSSWLSILQISQAASPENQCAMADTIMGMSTAVLARFIRLYTTYFPVANTAAISPAAKQALEHWSFGKAEMAKHYDKAAGANKGPTA